MADVFSKEKRSLVMSLVGSKNTKPEIVVRKFLFSKGLRYRIHTKHLPGKPDIVLKKYGTVIFVNGCFWHGHDNCGHYLKPKTNKKFWNEKITNNLQRDKRNISGLKKLGWNVIVIWECQLKTQKREKILMAVYRKIKGNAKKDSI